MLLQHLFNTILLGLYYSLLACGFYFSSVSCRHFNFATGSAFLLGPYAVLIFSSRGLWPLGIIAGIVSCVTFGWLYQMLSIWLSSKGSREGHLLIISLGIMAIIENSLVLAFGSASQALWPLASESSFISSAHIRTTKQEVVLILVSGATILGLLLLWRKSLFGVSLRGLIESRLNLLLRGYNVRALEACIAATGFLLAGLGGTLWGISSRVRPSMSMEASLIGVVTFIIGPMFARSIWGIILTSLAIAALKLPMSLFLEGDWGMTVPLILFFTALVFYRGRLILTVSGRLN